MYSQDGMLQEIGNYNFSTKYPSGNPYMHDMIVTDGRATGGTPAGGPYVNSWAATVSVTGDSVTIVADYESGSSVFPYTFTAIGTIALVGSMSGTWSDTISDSGTWTSTSGQATNHTGDTSWTKQFGNTVPFTFTTDDSGSGSWHVNLRDSDFPLGAETHTLSVWINEAGRTMLISDNFDVIVD